MPNLSTRLIDARPTMLYTCFLVEPRIQLRVPRLNALRRTYVPLSQNLLAEKLQEASKHISELRTVLRKVRWYPFKSSRSSCIARASHPPTVIFSDLSLRGCFWSGAW